MKSALCLLAVASLSFKQLSPHCHVIAGVALKPFLRGYSLLHTAAPGIVHKSFHCVPLLWRVMFDWRRCRFSVPMPPPSFSWCPERLMIGHFWEDALACQSSTARLPKGPPSPDRDGPAPAWVTGRSPAPFRICRVCFHGDTCGTTHVL